MNIGNYIRTPKGIGKITNIYTGHNKQEDSGFCIDSCKEKFYCGRSAMKELKSSPNIIDLIELGDIVELFEEDDVYREITGFYEVLAYTIDRKEIGVRNKDGEIDFYPAENLRGIITYEQIASMEYKIGE